MNWKDFLAESYEEASYHAVYIAYIFLAFASIVYARDELCKGHLLRANIFAVLGIVCILFSFVLMLGMVFYRKQKRRECEET